MIFILFSGVIGATQARVSGQANSKDNDSAVALRYEEGEELFFTVILDRSNLGELPTVVIGNQIALELDTYSSLLEFAIEFDRANMVYSGWYIKEDYTFHLDVKDRNSDLTIKLADRTVIVPVNEYQFIGNYLYINEIFLKQVFKIDNKFDVDSLKLTIRPTEPIPLQQRLARRNKIGVGEGNKPQFVNLDRSYELLSPQILDMNLSAIYRDSTGDILSRYSVQGSRDIALLHTNFFLSGSQDTFLDSARLTFSRDSLNSQLLGPLNASRIEFGDIRPVRQARESSLSESRGIRITNTQFTNQIDNQLINIEGNIATGWDAQLFRSGVLLGQEFEVNNGRYNFLDIPLNFGLNQFEVILYGPQGQVLVEKIEKLVDRDLIGRQGFSYNFSVNQNNTSLLGVRDGDKSSDGFNASAALNWGVGGSSSIGFGAQSQFLGNEDQDFSINLGGSTILMDSVLLNSSISTTDLANSISLGSRSYLKGQAVNANIAFSQTKESKTNVVDANFQSNGSVKITRSFALPIENQIRVNLTELNDLYEVSNRIGFNNRYLSLFNSLNYTKIVSQDGASNNFLSGGLSMQGSIGPIFARASINYKEDQNGGFDIGSYQASLNWALSNEFRTQLTFDHNTETNNTSSSFYVGWLNENIELNSTSTYSDLAGWKTNIATRFTLSGQDIAYDTIYQTNRALGQSGSLAVRVFHDLNDNAVYDLDEPILPNVKVNAVQAFRKADTNKHGIATITGVANYKSTDITVDQDTLPDPFMTPVIEGVSIKFRSGLVDKLDFPITMGTDIEGRIEIVKGDEVTRGRSITVELIDKNGNVVNTARSAMDGYYIFTKVIPGQYILKINSEDLARKDIRKLNHRSIVITQASEYISDIDFLLEQQSYKASYFASLGKFESYKNAIALASLLGKRQMSLRKYFFIQKTNDKYMLSIGAAPTENQIRDICRSKISINLNCEAVQLSLPTKPYELE